MNVTASSLVVLNFGMSDRPSSETPLQPPQLKPISYIDSYNNLFLINDYLQEVCRLQPLSTEFFDMQYLINSVTTLLIQKMKSAA